LTLSSVGTAWAQAGGAGFAAGAEFAAGNEAACVECHDETSDYPVLSILKTRHGVKADARTPLASGHACQSCHGPSARHVENDDLPTAVSFRGDRTPTREKNNACLGCHQGGARMHWTGSAHESRDLACVDCHKIHAQEDPVMRTNTSAVSWLQADAQAGVCFQCHKDQRAQMSRFSTHPIREGQVSCSDCHNPHGGAGPRNLVKNNVNETCYTCHAEKRGPFLWEHTPARDDCTNCHTPHGSNHRPLLKVRLTSLCQECHQAGRHPSDFYDARRLPPANGGSRYIGRSCLGCHTEVHGSNHPSGVRWSR
jgi:DmsE family decaheme c-type cytochrome